MKLWDAFSDSEKDEDAFPNRARARAFGVIMATCSFTRGARKTARKNNIDAIDGEQIAYRLIEMNVGIVVNDQPTFSEEEFLSWFRRWKKIGLSFHYSQKISGRFTYHI